MAKTSVRKHPRRLKTGKVIPVVKHSRSLKSMSYNDLKRHNIHLKPLGDADRDGVRNKFDCRPLDKSEQGLLHRNIKSLRKTQEFQKLSRDKKVRLNKAFKTLERVSTREEVVVWFKEHKRFLVTGLGVTAALSIGIGLGAFGAAAFTPVKSVGTAFPAFKNLPLIRKRTRMDDASLFKSKKAQKLFINKDIEIRKLVRKGFSQKQGDLIVESRILQAETKMTS